MVVLRSSMLNNTVSKYHGIIILHSLGVGTKEVTPCILHPFLQINWCEDTELTKLIAST